MLTEKTPMMSVIKELDAVGIWCGDIKHFVGDYTSKSYGDVLHDIEENYLTLHKANGWVVSSLDLIGEKNSKAINTFLINLIVDHDRCSDMMALFLFRKIKDRKTVTDKDKKRIIGKFNGKLPNAQRVDDTTYINSKGKVMIWQL